MSEAALDRVWYCDRGWQPVNFGFCPSERAWDREMRRLKIANEPYPVNDKRDAICSRFDSVSIDPPYAHRLIVLVAVSDRFDKVYATKPADVIALIVHEAMHVWRFIRKDIGEAKPSTEFEAYAMQQIAGGLIKAYLDTRINRRKEVRSKMAKATTKGGKPGKGGKGYPPAKGGKKGMAC